MTTGTVRIVTVVFGGEPYTQMARVFRRSCRLAMPEVRFTQLQGQTPAEDGRPWDCRMNTEKLRLWVEASGRYGDENLVLADCDMLAVGDVRHVFADRSFDVGYTRRSEILPLNGGILFVRPTLAARRWLAALWRINEAMREDPAFHAPFRARYHGMNQAAMGYLIEQPVAGVRVRAFPCSRYNLLGNDLIQPDPDAVFVHIKSALRKLILGQPVGARDRALYGPMAARWHAIEATL
jgi:hypothetical protein